MAPARPCVRLYRSTVWRATAFSSACHNTKKSPRQSRSAGRVRCNETAGGGMEPAGGCDGAAKAEP